MTISETRENKSLLTVSKPPISPSLIVSPGSSSTLSVPKLTSDRYLMPTAEIYPSKATMSRRTSSDTQSPSQSDTSPGAGSSGTRTPSIANGYAGGKTRLEEPKTKLEERRRPTAATAPTAPQEDLDVQSVINERRPSKLKTHDATGASTTTSIASDQYSAMMRGEGYSHIYVTTEERSEEIPSPCGNASESTGTGSLSVAGSLSAVASLSIAVSAGAAGTVSNGSGNGSGNTRSGNSNDDGVHIGEGGAIGSDVRIYVDDTDSASSSNGQRRGGRLRDDEAQDVSTTVSSATTMRNGRGSGGTDESKETSERPSSIGGSLDPS